MDDKIKSKILKMVPYGLYVVTCISKDGKTQNAFTGSWLSQVSFKPPLIMIGSQKDSLSTKLIIESGKFLVNFVDDSQSDIVKHFFKPAHIQGDKLSTHNWIISENTKCSILEDGLAYLECEVKESYTPGDHSIIVGEIISAKLLREASPLHMHHTSWHYAG